MNALWKRASLNYGAIGVGVRIEVNTLGMHAASRMPSASASRGWSSVFEMSALNAFRRKSSWRFSVGRALRLTPMQLLDRLAALVAPR
jgi:hypothetical protein